MAETLHVEDARLCTKCNTQKPPKAFTRKRSRWCNTCHNTYHEAYRKTARGLERTRAASLAWVERNRDRAEASNERYRKSEEGRDRRRVHHLEKSYGMAPGARAAMFAQQGSRCACCSRTNPGGRGWHIDHNHESGRVRGIVCGNCNIGVGLLGDDQRGAQLAVNYLSLPYPPDVEEYLAITGDLREVF